MMMFSGMERSEKQWEELLGGVGLGVKKISKEKRAGAMFSFQSIIEAVKMA